MRTSVLVLLLAVLSGAAVYEISNGFCVLKYNAFKQEFSVSGCYDKNYPKGFEVVCHVKESSGRKGELERVNLIFGKDAGREKKPILFGEDGFGVPMDEYTYTRFSEDIGNGKFHHCQIDLYMDIKEESSCK